MLPIYIAVSKTYSLSSSSRWSSSIWAALVTQISHILWRSWLLCAWSVSMRRHDQRTSEISVSNILKWWSVYTHKRHKKAVIFVWELTAWLSWSQDNEVMFFGTLVYNRGGDKSRKRRRECIITQIWSPKFVALLRCVTAFDLWMGCSQSKKPVKSRRAFNIVAVHRLLSDLHGTKVRPPTDLALNLVWSCVRYHRRGAE